MSQTYVQNYEKKKKSRNACLFVHRESELNNGYIITIKK